MSDERPLSFLGAAGWTLLVALVLDVALAVLEAARPGALGDLVSVTACKVLAHSAVLLAILRVHEPDGSIRRVVALERTGLSAVLLALVLGGALALPAAWVNGLFAERFAISPEQAEAIEKLYSAATPQKRALLVVTLAFAMPIADELFFRGVLFTKLARGRRVDRVVLATAVYDVLLGFNPRGAVALAGLVVVLGLVRARTGSVVPSLVARVAFFGASVGPMALGREDADASGKIIAASAALAVLAFVTLWMFGARGSRVGRGADVAP